jgi:hypothetical protein
VGILYFSALVNARCKSIPGSPDWPSDQEWAALNQTLGRQLIKPTPPGAVCHPEQPTYNPAVCPTVQTEWSTFPFHHENPVSSAWNNFNNDTCVPDAQYTCSPLGYPAYVVNAMTAEHVAARVKFVGWKNIRLIVKGTGHDYMGKVSIDSSGLFFQILTKLGPRPRIPFLSGPAIFKASISTTPSSLLVAIPPSRLQHSPQELDRRC